MYPISLCNVALISIYTKSTQGFNLTNYQNTCDQNGLSQIQVHRIRSRFGRDCLRLDDTT